MFISSTGLVLMMILHLGAKQGSTETTHLELDDDYYREICDIQDSFNSPYVRAFYEDPPTTTTSCEGEPDKDDINIHATSLAQEVHVIRVVFPRGGRSSSSKGSATAGHRRRVITNINLQIKPQDTSGNLEKLVFILVSSMSVKWKIHMDRRSLSTELQISVSNGSQVLPDHRLNMVVHVESALPSSTDSLLDYITQKHGSITTFVEVKPNKTIAHTVGIVDTSRNCRESAMTRTTVAKEISGCLVTSTRTGRRNKDVHVLELHENTVDAAARAAGGVLPVVIEIHPKLNSKPLVRKHLLLMLKSHRPTLWKLRTTGLRGTLDIVSDHQVDTFNVTMPSVRVVNEKLTSLTGIELVTWTSEKYGEPVSYTSAQLANKFDLTVDGQVDKKLQVQCNAKSMVISLSKKFQTGKYVIIHLPSLVDRSCRPEQNTTHYYWRTPLSACGTTKVQQAGQIIYRNAVVLKNVGGQFVDHSGSGLEPTADATLLDDESITSDSRRDFQIEVQCAYPVVNEKPEPDVHFQLRLYKDPRFQLEMPTFPAIVGNKDKLFFEASLATADPRTGVVIENCSASSASWEQPAFNLIKNRCPFENRIKWMEADTLPHTKRFEFAFGRFLSGSDAIFVNCHLWACSKTSAPDSAFSECPSEEFECPASAYGVGSYAGVSSKLLSIGPLILQSTSVSGTTVKDASTTASSLVVGGQVDCSPVTHTEGLDPPAVIGIAFAAFTIGVLLTGALWFIHSHTGPLKKHAKGLRSAEASGESTPSSTAPMAVRPLAQRHV